MRNKKNNIWKVLACVGITTLLAFFLSQTIVYYFTSMLAFKSSIETKDYEIIDFYCAILDENSPKKVSNNIILVTVDGLPREEIATIIDSVKKASPRVIGVDILFEYKCGIDSDLVETTDDNRIVLAATIDGDSLLHKSYFCNVPHKSHYGVAILERVSPISMVRKYRTQYQIKDSLYYSFASEVIKTGGMKIRKTYAEEPSFIYFPTVDFITIESNMLVKDPERCKEILKDKIVLIGDDKNMQDVHPTAFDAMSGLRIQASIIETMLGDHNIRIWPKWVEWMMAIISCIGLILLNIFLTTKMPSIGKLLFRFAQLVTLYLCFLIGFMIFKSYDLYVDITPTLSMIAVGLLAYDFWKGGEILIKKYIIKKQ